MENETKLLPCPFCGSDGETESNASGYCVICKECLCEGPLCYSSERAENAWNKRAPMLIKTAIPDTTTYTAEMVPPNGKDTSTITINVGSGQSLDIEREELRNQIANSLHSGFGCL